MKIALSAESAVDLPKELLDKYDIHTTPFTILLGDKVLFDGEFDINEIFAYVNKTGTLPKTSAVNEAQFHEYFKTLLKDYDAVIHFSISSEISSACSNAKVVASQYDNIFVIDTRTLSTGVALLAIYASKLIKQKLLPKEIVKRCEARIPFLQVSSVLNRLDYLHKGGRCSALALFGANILKLRVQILVKNGRMVPAKKYRGDMDSCIINYVNDTLKTFDNPDKDEVFVTSTTATEKQIADVTAILKDYGFRHITVTRAGATIACHCGENCLGLLYINDGGAD